MAATKRLLPASLNAKKRDEPAQIPFQSSGSMLRPLRNIRRRRILLGILAVALIVLFIRNIPTDLKPVSERYDRYGPLRSGGSGPGSQDAADAMLQGTDKAAGQTFEGPIRFYNLATSLRGAAAGARYDTRGNVLFAMSSLKSASRVVRFACDMAQQNRSRVHVAFTGRDEHIIKDILTVNGLTDAECPLFWHDGRPDYSIQSTTERMGISVRACLGHIQASIRMSAIVVDHPALEDPFFTSAVETKAGGLGVPLLTMPAGNLDSLSWVSSLDTVSLSHWDTVNVDIIIHATSDTSGSLIRLLRSIQNADYTGFALPRVTIELPTDVDPFVSYYLSQFQWPPGVIGVDGKLVIRHRIDAKLMTPAQASSRVVESFYPMRPAFSHVLMLSPDVELSRAYYQTMLFALLEFKYSARSAFLSDALAGISLELPLQSLGKASNASPLSTNTSDPVVLWQQPTSNAGLYFGDKWLELHSFLSSRLSTDPQMLQIVSDVDGISEKRPAWLKAMLEMMRARGYYMLYPIVAQAKGSPIATVHRENYESPEEYRNSKVSEEKMPDKTPDILLDEAQILDAGAEVDQLRSKEPLLDVSSSVISLFNLKAGEHANVVEADSSLIPLFSYDGQQISWLQSERLSSAYADDFATSVGGCSSLDERDPAKQGSIEFMFCTSGSQT